MQMFGQRPEYTSNRPEVHDVLKHWRSWPTPTTRPGPPGETNVEALETLAAFYGHATTSSVSPQLSLHRSPLRGGALRTIVEKPRNPASRFVAGWTGSNHDVRAWPPVAGGHPDRTRLALLMLLTLRGTPVLYQATRSSDRRGADPGRDPRPRGPPFWPLRRRDPERTPMPGTGGPNGIHRPDRLPGSRWEIGGQQRDRPRGDPTSILHSPATSSPSAAGIPFSQCGYRSSRSPMGPGYGAGHAS